MSEPSHVHTGGCQSLNTSTSETHKRSRFCQQGGKKPTEPEFSELRHTSVGYIFTQTGGHKSGPAESFCAQGKVLSKKEIYLASLCLHSKAEAAMISIRHSSGPLKLITY